MGGKTVGQWVAIFQDRIGSTTERRQAAEALGYLGPAARSAVPCLIQALAEPRTGNKKVDEDNEWLRYLAIKALGRIGPAAAEAVPKLFPETGDGRRATGTWGRSIPIGPGRWAGSAGPPYPP